MVVIEFDPPRSVSLSALDENNVTLKDTSSPPENGQPEFNQMIARATLICRPNSHPFQERYLTLENAIKVGRSVARVKPALNNAIFDCKVLSRNHALFWYKEGKFYLQDTKSSNGTFVNNQRLSKGSEESVPREVCSGDIVQFGVDVMENSRKVTHGCIVATVKLYLPDGKEAKASPSTGIQEEEDTTDLGKQDLYKLNQWIQEAVVREQVLETKLGSLQRIVNATCEAAELGWTALMEEDRLLTRIESLENQLIVTSKNFNDDKLREEIRKLYDEKNIYQDISKESLRKVLTEKMETLKKLQETERSLSNAEDERDNMKELNDKLNTQILELASKFESESEELQMCKTKLQEADHLQQRLEQEMESRQEILRQAQEKETILLAEVESRQAEVDFTKEQLANWKQRYDTIKAASEEVALTSSHENECDNADNDSSEKENCIEALKQQQATRLDSEWQNKTMQPESMAVNKHGECLQELLDEERQKNRKLEEEVERRQMEAQDGWAAAAQLQQYFRKLHNLLVKESLKTSLPSSSSPASPSPASPSSVPLDGGDDDAAAAAAEPCELAETIRMNVLNLKDECNRLLAANTKHQEVITQLSKRLGDCKESSSDRSVRANGTEHSTMKENMDTLSDKLKEMEMSKLDITEECLKWKLAYQTLVSSSNCKKSEDVLNAGEMELAVRNCRTRDSGVRDLQSPDDSHDVVSQFLETKSELETLKVKYDNVQSEKKELEEEFTELKENYSLLSSQSKTVTALCVMPLLVLFTSFFLAFYRFFSRLTATVEPR